MKTIKTSMHSLPGPTPVDLKSEPLLDEKGKANYGVPGPGAYQPPSTFGPHHSRPGAARKASPDLPSSGLHDDQQEVRSLLATAPAYTLPSRAMPKVPMPAEDSPGPAYKPNMAACLNADARAVFGTADRDAAEKVFISRQHSVATSGLSSPGPGTYRADKLLRARGPRAGTMKFGSAPQRPAPDREACAVPGGAYMLPSTLNKTAFSFAAPAADKDEIRHVNRTCSQRFISADHNHGDHGELTSDEPGPGKYSTVPAHLLSTYPRAASCTFGRNQRLGDRHGKEFISEDHLRHEPDGAASPGPAYTGLPSMLASTGPLFGSAPKLWDAERGGNKAGPFISMQHSATLLEGTDSPGPGAYTIKSGRHRGVPGVGGDLPAYSFGDSKRDPISKSLGNRTPGPGAYQPRAEHLSRCAMAPAYKLAGKGASSLTAPDAGSLPGPGAYDISSSTDSVSGVHKDAAWQLTSTVNKAPAWRLGSRPNVNYSNEVPGPGSYDPVLPGEATANVQQDKRDETNGSPQRGYTFGVKDRLRLGGKTTATVRYQGALAAQSEGLGMDSPGPGAYSVDDDRSVAPNAAAGAPKFERARRSNPKQFISRQHVDPEATAHVPGPGAYDLGSHGLQGLSSKYRNTGAFSFGSGERSSLATVKF